MVGILDFEEANAVQKFGVFEDELTAPSGILASRIKVDEAFVETDSALEKSFIPQLLGDGIGFARAAFVDEIECAILGVPGAGGSAASSVVDWAAIGGGDELERFAEAMAYFVGDEEGCRHRWPEGERGESICNAASALSVRIEDFVGLDVAEGKAGEELFVSERFRCCGIREGCWSLEGQGFR